MPSAAENYQIYRDLASLYERQAQAQLRDRFLLLAADAALANGQADEAERLRQRLLQHSPYHMVKPFASFAEAMRSPDVQGYLHDLRESYPPETAAQALGSPDAPPVPRPPEPLKVFRIQEEEAAAARPPARAPVSTRPPTRLPQPPKVPAPPRVEPLPAIASAQPSPPTRHSSAAPAIIPVAPPARPAPRPAPVPPPIPFAAEPAPRPGRKPSAPGTSPADEEGSGGWVSSGLFAVALLVGLALGAYTLARPFLPAGWLPQAVKPAARP